MRRAAFRIHVSAGRVRIDGPVLASNPEQHQFGPVVELQTEPIPAHLIRLQLVGEELMVHPTQAVDRVLLAIQCQHAMGDQSRQRNIVRRPPRALRLLAHAVDAVNHWRLHRLQAQFEREVVRYGPQLLRCAVADVRPPVAVPDCFLRLIRARHSRSCPVQSLGVKEPPAVDVAQRQMRHPDVAHVPHIRLLRAAIHALAEERQLEAKFAPFGRVQVAGIIPPLGLILGMIVVIARKLVMITGKRDSPDRHQRQCGSILHGSHRWGPAASRSARDKDPR